MEQTVLNAGSTGAVGIADVNCKAPKVDELRLTIDAVNLTVDLPQKAIDRVHKFISEIPESSKAIPAYPFHSWHSRHYKAGFKAYLNELLAWEPSRASALVCETGAKRPGARNTLFRWNPAKCPSGVVAGIVFNDYLGISSTYLRDSTVSHIDLAIDVPGVKVDDVAFSYPKMQRTQNMFSGGRTMYLGVQSGATRIAFYDKRAQIVSANSKLGTFLAELKEPVPPHDLLRIEARLQPTPFPLEELSALPNPFVKVRVHVRPKTLNRLEDMALSVARYEGLRRATAKLTTAERKTLYRKLQKDGTPKWWQSETVWNKQFPVLIDGFSAPFAWPLH